MIKISDLITDDTNIIEIYLLNPDNSKLSSWKTSIYNDDTYLNKVRKNFKLTRNTTYKYYMRNNLTYVYDTSNDSQYVFARKLEKENTTHRRLYGISYNEMKLQPYSFACTNNIDNVVEYKFEEFKINNRLSIIIKNNNIYICYKHNKDVDIDKIQETINYVIKKLHI